MAKVRNMLDVASRQINDSLEVASRNGKDGFEVGSKIEPFLKTLSASFDEVSDVLFRLSALFTLLTYNLPPLLFRFYIVISFISTIACIG